MRILLLFIACMMVGCSVALTADGRMVREVALNATGYCDFLGVVEGSHGSGWDVPEDQLGAMNELRNNVAAMGGNAYVMSSSASSEAQTIVQAEAYLCPEAKPYIPAEEDVAPDVTST